MIYKITYYIKTPVITITPIHFDALLSAVHPAMHNIPALARRNGRTGVINAPIPVDSVKRKWEWIWCCTTAEYSDDAIMYSDKITKRKTGTDYYYLSGKHTPRTGTGRDRCETIYGIMCSSVSFLAASSDLKELERICRRVKNIGGLRKMGYGEVCGMEIKETDLKWEECLVRDGRALRTIPKSMLKGCQSKRITVHPPYWLDEWTEGVFPGDQAELREDVRLVAYHGHHA